MDDFNPEEWLDEIAQRKGKLQIHRLKRLLKETTAENKQLSKKVDLANDRLALSLAIRDPKKPKAIRARTRKRREGTALAMASDWHVEEVVHAAGVNGKNEYNPKISRKSAENYFDGVAWLTKFCQTDVEIRNLILWIGGDMITGYLHEENKKNNAYSPTKAILLAQNYLMMGIDYLLEELDLERLIIPCSYGNHGRTTKKPEFATGAENSYEWMMYHTLKEFYRDDDRVEFIIPDGELLYLKVYDHNIRFHHGDAIQYHGGVGGLAIPLHKSIYAWNQVEMADLTIIGHWHQFCDYGHTVVNGSLIGYNAYAVRKKLAYQDPMQGFMVIDKKRGKSLVTPIWVR